MIMRAAPETSHEVVIIGGAAGGIAVAEPRLREAEAA
jgi:hypothetical protein